MTQSPAVRVRFAPSPTGYLHIGGVRTALCSWLWAKRNQGTFILRIEDTDVERNTQEAVDVIFESLDWLGLDWDEGPRNGGPHGPYFQSERTAIYEEYAERLIDRGHAYRCFATKEDIAQQRADYEAKHGKKGFRFESPWRDRNDGDRNVPHVVRFKAPTAGTTKWNDRIKGPIEVANDTLQDFVLMRSNGLPLYNFGCVVDDVTMGVTLVTRGDDHVINTPPQILMYQALGVPAPEFAHMPLILAPNGEKLSKRHAAVAVLDYRDMGYLPDGILNYLVRLGWSHGDQEIFTRDELIEKFDWSACGKTGGKYDLKKLAYVQAEHLRMLPEPRLGALSVPFFAKRDLTVAPDDPMLLRALPQIKPRATTLADVAEACDYFFRDPPTMDDAARKKFLTAETSEHLRALADYVAPIEPFDTKTLHDAVITWLEARDLKLKVIAQPARVALTGRANSPGVFEVMEILGRDLAVRRLRRGAALAAETC